MHRLLVLLPAAMLALSAAPVFAQDAPEGAYRDLWCGTAFNTAMKDAPFAEADLAAAKAAGDKATEEQTAMIAQATMRDAYLAGGAALIEKATTAYKGAGFTDESFTKVKTETEPKVATQIMGNGSDAEFTFEECSGLIPGGDPAAAMAPAQ